jgi:deoxyhypusine synthase
MAGRRAIRPGTNLMAQKRVIQKRDLLSTPTQPLTIDERKSVAVLLEKMQGVSFQGRTLAIAYQIWKRMLGDRVMILMGMAGAMVPAGMRLLLVYMIKNRLIDCLVTTGANLFHDIHETLGRKHFQCAPEIDDVVLQKNLIDRMYDTLADEEQFRQADEMIGAFAAGLDQSRAYTTREFLNLLGKHLATSAGEDGIVTSAAKAGVPLYCPAIGDSSIGIGIAENRHLGKNRFTFDLVGDVLETARLAAESPASGVIYFGGGTPKNFVNQTEVTATFIRSSHSGHKYALQIVTDSPHWGGLSGCTFAESQSWGKIAHDASFIDCHCDSTIAMPMLVTALSENASLIRKRAKPVFEMGRELRFSFPK